MTARLWAAALILIMAAAACGNGASPAAPSPQSGPSPQDPPGVPAPSPEANEVSFAPGRHRVGESIQPGRYFSDPDAGCYWERQSGTGGSAAETIAFGFVGFDAGQSVVDIAITDAVFEANAACGTWSNRPRSTPSGTVGPGTWVVGVQLAPGTYRAEAALGCYWERLRNFAGTPSSVIASELVPHAGAAFVNVLAGDAGLSTNAACGTWRAVSPPAPEAPPGLRTLPPQP